MEYLLQLFRGPSTRSSGLVLVSGTLGSGKTQLLHEFARRAVNDGALVLQASGSRAEHDLRMGVVEQLFRCAELPNELIEEIPELTSDAVENGTVRRICNSLLRACEGRSVVVAIDDVHFADTASLQTLLYLQRRMHPQRMLMILSEWDRPQPTLPLFRAELTRAPHSRIRLRLMSERTIGTVLERTAGHTIDPRLAPAIHRLSGGNPLLVHALIEDNHLECAEDAEGDAGNATDDGGAPRAGTPVVGRSFEMAVLACLYRWEPQMFSVASGMAVLGEHATPCLLGRLLDLDQRRVTQALEILTAAGLTTGNAFRHPNVASAVLASLSREEQTTLFTKATKLRLDLGMATTEIAAQIVAAGEADGDWTVPILTDAAEQELAEGKTSTAHLYLNLALAAATDDHQQLATLRTYFHSTWQTNPSAVVPHTAAMRQALVEGRLADKDIVALIRTLLWQGDLTAVSAVLADAKRSDVTLGHDSGRELLHAFHWFFGPSFTRFWNLDDLCRRTVVGGAGLPTGTEAIAVFSRVWARGGDDESSSIAERVLSACRADDLPLELITTAILVLADGGRRDRALLWCDELIDHATRRGAVMWLALLTATRADVCLRDGDPETAAELAADALSLAGEENWGVSIGYPLSILIQADIESGRVDDAVKQAGRTVPSAMLETVIGIRYLHARGRLALTTGRATEALDDLRRCARWLRVWHLDVPAQIPLTTSLIEAAFQAGETEIAGDTADSRPAEPPLDQRTRGALLRILAGSEAPREKPGLLRKAVDYLRASGDRMELLRPEAELLQACAELAPAAEAGEFAFGDDLSNDEGAPALPPEPSLTNDPDGPDDPAPTVATGLSRAELRVAKLAVQGDTNREISDKLWITVSTVEQHLTRIYRKLNLSGRAGLTTLLRSELLPADALVPQNATGPASADPEAGFHPVEMGCRANSSIEVLDAVGGLERRRDPHRTGRPGIRSGSRRVIPNADGVSGNSTGRPRSLCDEQPGRPADRTVREDRR
ncbi:AAA family ATPase [Streptomyces sp. RPA4-5]|uniref:helix-turn-helix transcriptional regulator n=1 Tax=Streptomyces sp. RPA4-5 TaxID=2721245 RepID=UPI00143E93D8|nr:LuxR family transcriptional regulator [Streptomyces sp. RPA4-5]QIY59044.1 AAA family ATPase [Streptomyces sp. RPA4-5]